MATVHVVDVAVDPLEGTNIVAYGQWNALAVLAIADHGNLLHAPDMYMEKIAVGPEAVGKVDINASVTDNLRAVAKAKNKDIEDVVVNDFTPSSVMRSSFKKFEKRVLVLNYIQ